MAASFLCGASYQEENTFTPSREAKRISEGCLFTSVGSLQKLRKDRRCHTNLVVPTMATPQPSYDPQTFATGTAVLGSQNKKSASLIYICCRPGFRTRILTGMGGRRVGLERQTQPRDPESCEQQSIGSLYVPMCL